MTSPADQLASRTGYVLIKLGEEALAAAERALAPLGLRAKHVNVLTLIETHRLSQQQLSTGTGLDRTTMVGLVDDLEAAGYATRERDPDDRRRYVVSPTPAGLTALRAAAQALDEVEAAVFSGLTVAERRTLHRLATRALDATRQRG
ncbi:MarR family winged helix-turn-helix transcriptional regulator [Krasilnikovia sp. MM14-A1259]|uniref:MarR family winged helix-turn-helix transcriptional regulator n=1 Tax=Krasilnikovia sp. MM14-A1259 TaxID=3373539 RepID=UPI0037F9EE53